MRLQDKQFDKNKWADLLKIKQAEDKAVKEALRANKAAGLMISEGGKGGSPNTPTPDWDKDWPKPGTRPRPDDRPTIPTKLANFLTPSGTGKTLSDEWYEKGLDTIMESTKPGYTRDERIKILNHQYLDQVKKPQNGLMISHHTGDKHFTEPSIEELIDGLINGDIPRGTLGDEETENRLIQERENQLQQQSLMINGQNTAGLPYQDGRAPTHMFYNRPFGYPSDLPFIKTQDMKDEAYKMFLINTKRV